jgi:hypothetical protein
MAPGGIFSQQWPGRLPNTQRTDQEKNREDKECKPNLIAFMEPAQAE